MKIVFGTYSILIKQIDPKEFGVEIPDGEKVQFEVRQQIFHLFWIPVFPIYRVYGLRKNDGLYELNADLMRHMKARSWRVPILSFSLPIIALLIFGFIELNEVYSSYQHKKRWTAQIEAEAHNLNSTLDKIRPNALLTLMSNSYSSDILYFKVMDIKDSVLECERIFIHKRNTPLAEIIKLANEIDSHQSPFNLRKEQLRTSIPLLPEHFQDNQSDGMVFNSTGKSIYRLNAIHYTDQPLLDVPGTGSFGHPGLHIQMANNGLPLLLDSITVIEGHCTFNGEFPIEIPSYQGYLRYFNLRSPDYNFDTRLVFDMHVRDENNKYHRVRFEGKNLDLTASVSQ